MRKSGGWIIPSFRGLAYLASANFLARSVVLLGNFIQSFLSYELILLYGAHLDSQIILFFKAVFMIPVFLLGVLVFFGIEKESFGVVLYPTLMLLFLVLLRYGAEGALLLIHWDVHKWDQAPMTLYYFTIDLISIIILLLYVYFSLASGPSIRPTPPGDHLLEAQLLSEEMTPKVKDTDSPKEKFLKKRKKKVPAAPPEEDCPVQPPERPPPSPKFNYKIRRNIAKIPKDSPELVLVQELDHQRHRNSQLIHQEEEEIGGLNAEDDAAVVKRRKAQSLKIYEQEPKRRSLIFETDLDASEGGSGSPVETLEPSYSRKSPTEEAERTPRRTPTPTPQPAPQPPEVTTIQEDDDDEWEYEYEEEEEEEPEVVVTLPRPYLKTDLDQDKEEEDDEGPSIPTQAFKSTAV